MLSPQQIQKRQRELVASFDSDEETMERLKDPDETYAMVTELMDIAMMMGKTW